MVKKVVLDGYTTSPEDPTYSCYTRMGDTVVYDRTAPGQVTERIGDEQIVLTNKALITREVMQACPQLRYIGVLATGYNVVDMQAAEERGIVVTNVPEYSTQAVVQHAMALLLHRMSRVAAYDAQVKAGAWVQSPDFCFFAEPTQELCGKVFGVIGFGSIGQAMTRAALGMGMQVLVHTPHPPKEAQEDVRFVSLDELLEGSDIVSLHCPLKDDNRGMIGESAIAKMKPGAMVVNTARGALVDAQAMAGALHTGKISCYMADVMDTEPPKADNPLLHAPNTVITPHVAWAPRQTRERLARIAVENVEAYLAGTPRNVVSR